MSERDVDHDRVYHEEQHRALVLQNAQAINDEKPLCEVGPYSFAYEATEITSRGNVGLRSNSPVYTGKGNSR